MSATDIRYIANGVDVDASWTNVIAISYDGVNWATINSINLSVAKHAINLNSSAPNSHPERNKESGFVIVVKRSDSEGALLKFNPENIQNQRTWIGRPNQAVSDIASWIGDNYQALDGNIKSRI
jgi:hypothetical protein